MSSKFYLAVVNGGLVVVTALVVVMARVVVLTVVVHLGSNLFLGSAHENWVVGGRYVGACVVGSILL